MAEHASYDDGMWTQPLSHQRDKSLLLLFCLTIPFTRRCSGYPFFSMLPKPLFGILTSFIIKEKCIHIPSPALGIICLQLCSDHSGSNPTMHHTSIVEFGNVICQLFFFLILNANDNNFNLIWQLLYGNLVGTRREGICSRRPPLPLFVSSYFISCLRESISDSYIKLPHSSLNYHIINKQTRSKLKYAHHLR